MAKKRFNTADNPALSYMTGAELEQSAQEAESALSPDGAATFNELVDIGRSKPSPDIVLEIVERIKERGVTPEDAAQLARLYDIGKEAGRRGKARDKEQEAKPTLEAVHVRADHGHSKGQGNKRKRLYQYCIGTDYRKRAGGLKKWQDLKQ